MAKASNTHNRSRRRRARGKAYIVFAAVLIIAAAVLAVTVFFRVSSIEVAGVSQYTREEITAAAGINRGDSLMLLETQTVAADLYERFAYIQSVTVEKRFPGTIAINITEAVPVSALEHRGAYWLVGTNGRVLDQTSRQEKEDYISLLGLDVEDIQVGQAPVLGPEEPVTIGNIADLLTALSDNGLSDLVYSIDLTDKFSIGLTMREKYTVDFGTVEDPGYKVRYLVKVMAYLTESGENRPGAIDISGTGEAYFIPQI